MNLEGCSCGIFGIIIIMGFILIKIKTSNVMSNIKNWFSRKINNNYSRF